MEYVCKTYQTFTQTKTNELTMKTKKKIEKLWVNGGRAVYGDNPLIEALYALEDEAIWLEKEGGRFIPRDRMIKVMIAYEEFLSKELKEMEKKIKQEIVEEVKRIIDREMIKKEMQTDEDFTNAWNYKLDQLKQKLTK